MKRLCVALLLLFTANFAWADWVRLTESDAGIVFFVDPTTVRRSGNLVRMWVLHDYKTTQITVPHKDSYLSSKVQNEYDCQDEKSRNLYFTWHSGNMGGGKVVYTSSGTPSSWTPISPGSVNQSLFNEACANSPRASTAAPPASNPDFDVVNRASQNILNIYVKHVDANVWGEDRLPGILEVGEKSFISLPRDGRCHYDIRVVYSDLSSEERRSQNVCALSDVAFDGSARRMAPAAKSAPTPPTTSSAGAGGSNPTPSRPSPATAQADSTGSGFRVARGAIVTNHHVIDGCSRLRVNGTAAQVRGSDARSDLALLGVDLPGPSASLRTQRAAVGEPVAVAGYPLHDLLSGFNMTTGTLSSLSGLGGDTRYLQITAPVQPGNSGGPMLDSAGNLMGVVVSRLDAIRLAKIAGDMAQNVNFAIHVNVLRAFLDANSVDYDSASSNKPLAPTAIAEKARGFTVLVECWK